MRADKDDLIYDSNIVFGHSILHSQRKKYGFYQIQLTINCFAHNMQNNPCKTDDESNYIQEVHFIMVD